MSVGKSAYTLILKNHGAIVMGATVGEAWMRMYYLDKVCRAQMNLIHAGEKLPVTDSAAMKKL